MACWPKSRLITTVLSCVKENCERQNGQKPITGCSDWCIPQGYLGLPLALSYLTIYKLWTAENNVKCSYPQKCRGVLNGVVQLVSLPRVLCSFPSIKVKIHSFLSSALNWLHLLFLSLPCELKKVYMCFFSIFTRQEILTFMNLPFDPSLSFCKELQAQMGLSPLAHLSVQKGSAQFTMVFSM